MKITSKTIAIISSLIVVGLSGFLIYSILNKEASPEDFVHSNWLYRRGLNIENNQALTLIDEDVLITLDTKELITNNKLKEDCTDLRFLDENNFSQLKYWIEGGCNTNETQIWIRIPLLPKEGKNIYIYYGNEKALDAQEPWNGNFIVQQETPCSNNSIIETIFNERFVLASESYGRIGGNENHSHKLNVPQEESCDSYISSFEKNDEICTESFVLNESLSMESNIPEYFETYYCKTTEGFFTNNTILMFDTKEPEGWLHYSNLDNKFPRGKTVEKESIITLGTNEHLHSTKCSPNNIGDVSKKVIYISQNFVTANKTLEPPYYTLNYAFNKETSYAPENSIVLFDEIPPLGWELYKEIDGSFPKGDNNNYKETRGFSSHSHRITISPLYTTVTIDLEYFRPICIQDNNTITLETTVTESLPPYVTAIFAKKKTSQKVSIIKEINDENITKETDDSIEKENSLTEGIISENISFKEENGSILGVSAPGKPTALLTEGLTNPSFIQSATPVFSAIYTDPDEDNASAYQIQVNTSSEFSGTEMWDSTKTATTVSHNTRSADYTYAGTTLTNTTNTLYWRIKFWDIDDEPSEWSDPASFVDLWNKIKIEGLSFGGVKLD